MISHSVSIDFIWRILNPTIIEFFEIAKWERKKSQERETISNALLKISPDLTVKHGPFKGMVYPETKSVGSTLVPKLIGSYERELHPLLEKLFSENYSEIVDIGCAEGYYAVGFAMRVPAARIFAYDTNEEAIQSCKKMAEVNAVAERLTTGSFCDAETLKSLPLTEKSLIISDCEGYEKELFSETVIPFLAKHDLLIEVHDMMDIEIGQTLRQRFQKTHTVTAVLSIDDITKAQTYDYGELSEYDLATRKMLLAENRLQIMEWFYLSPRAS